MKIERIVTLKSVKGQPTCSLSNLWVRIEISKSTLSSGQPRPKLTPSEHSKLRWLPASIATNLRYSLSVTLWLRRHACKRPWGRQLNIWSSTQKLKDNTKKLFFVLCAVCAYGCLCRFLIALWSGLMVFFVLWVHCEVRGKNEEDLCSCQETFSIGGIYIHGWITNSWAASKLKNDF